MATERKKVTNKTRSWVFKRAWQKVRKSYGKRYNVRCPFFLEDLAASLKHFWARVRIAAGITRINPVQTIRLQDILSIKALTRGQHKQAFSTTFYETYRV